MGAVADDAAATPAAAATPDSRAAGRLKRLLGAHWRGELPLWQAFWIHGAALLGVLALAVGALAMAASIGAGFGLRLASAALLLAWPASLVVEVWAAVGIWRSARQQVARGGWPGWPLAAMAATALWLLGSLVSAALCFAPRVADLAWIAGGGDRMGHLVVALSDDGRRLRLSGPIGLGDADEVEARLAAAPKAGLVEIVSPGGRPGEARRIGEAIRARAAQTRLIGRCEGACVLVFAAGSVRQMTPQARLGMHRWPSGSLNPLWERWTSQRLVDDLRRAGVSEAYVERTLAATPARRWNPGVDDLEAGGVVSVPAHPLEVGLPWRDGGRAEDIADALRTNATWVALDRHLPGVVTLAAQQMHAARAQGQPDDEVLLLAHRVVEALLPRMALDAGHELRVAFAALLRDQLEAARSTAGAPACAAVLAGDALARRALPAPLARREAAWLVDVSSEPVRTEPPRKPSVLELEVTRRTLGDRAPAALMSLWRPQGPVPQDARHCDEAIALLHAVGQLQPPERRLAVKLLFEK